MKTVLCFLLVLATGCTRTQQEPSELSKAVEESEKKALLQLRSLAEQGDAKAQFKLGAKYAKGKGIPKDSAQGAVWLRKAAEQGEVRAQTNLGAMYAEGDGVPKDLAQAVEWFRKAAEVGTAIAQNNLGHMYATGEGVPKDSVTAYMWQNLAAAQGDGTAKKQRDALEKSMTPAQIAEAQKLSREWKPKIEGNNAGSPVK